MQCLITNRLQVLIDPSIKTQLLTDPSQHESPFFYFGLSKHEMSMNYKGYIYISLTFSTIVLIEDIPLAIELFKGRDLNCLLSLSLGS